MTLAPAIHRCHDSQCGARERCERWLQRDTGNASTVHAMTLKAAWLPHSAICARYIRRAPIGVDDLPERGPAGWLVLGWLYGYSPAQLLLGRLRPTPAHRTTVLACWGTEPLPHPWDARISDVACGYDERLSDRHCSGCHRARAESPLDQLQALDQRHSEDGIRK